MDDIMNLTVQAKKNFIHRRVAKRDVLISIGGNVAYFNGFIELNETALFLWEHMKEPCTGNDLCAAMVEAYEVTKEKAAADIAGFLSRYLEQQMIEVLNEGAD
ncbi:MAG: PqqD family protein [Lachnospiraceae bacterium]